jgi:uncharacterized protein (TIGR03083 family)
MCYLGICKEITSMETPPQRLAMLHAEVEALTHYLASLSPAAWQSPSACDQWQVADVLAHLVPQADHLCLVIARGLQGDISPPAGLTPMNAHTNAQTAIADRERLGDQLLATFIAGHARLHTLLTGRGPQDWETACFYPSGLSTVAELLNLYITELTVHGWDMRSPLEPNFHLSVACLPTVIDTAFRPVRSVFRPEAHRYPNRVRPIRHRFLLAAPVETSTDIVIDRDGGHIESGSQAEADVILRCDPETYVLVIFGRLTLAEAMAAGRVVTAGDQGLAMAFGQSFRGGTKRVDGRC